MSRSLIRPVPSRQNRTPSCRIQFAACPPLELPRSLLPPTPVPSPILSSICPQDCLFAGRERIEWIAGTGKKGARHGKPSRLARHPCVGLGSGNPIPRRRSRQRGQPHRAALDVARMITVLMLAMGGAIGTLARYGLNGVISARIATFPLGTMVVNISGCFAIGFIAAISDPSFGRVCLKTGWRDFLMIGFCGGYTTFSSFGLQTLNLARDGECFPVALNVIGSNVLGLLATYGGWVCGRAVRSEEHTSELQSLAYLVCRLLLEIKLRLPQLDPTFLLAFPDTFRGTPSGES